MKNKKETILSKLNIIPNVTIKIVYKDIEIIINPRGYKYWHKNGRRHREDGPAVTWSDGSMYWYKNGKLHRQDGPAVIYNDGRNRWALNDIEYTEKGWKREIERQKRNHLK